MTIKPILFNSDMVTAIRDGRKTVTRRVVRFPPGIEPVGNCVGLPDGNFGWDFRNAALGSYLIIKPPCQIGDILYVRETWAEWTGGYVYKADGANSPCPLSFVDHWRPSIHMPKEAARIFLRVTDFRAEQLQYSFSELICPIVELQAEGIDIGDHCRECIDHYGEPCCVDTIDEDGSNLYGGECGMLDDPRSDFADLWDSTVKRADLGRFGWAADPWVWIIGFEPCERPEEWP